MGVRLSGCVFYRAIMKDLDVRKLRGLMCIPVCQYAMSEMCVLEGSVGSRGL